jgi:hypothetical protein
LLTVRVSIIALSCFAFRSHFIYIYIYIYIHEFHTLESCDSGDKIMARFIYLLQIIPAPLDIEKLIMMFNIPALLFILCLF